MFTEHEIHLLLALAGFLIFVRLTWPKNRRKKVTRSDLIKLLDELMD